jgi:hypothetical protein
MYRGLEWSREGVLFVEWTSNRSGGRAGSGEHKEMQLVGQVPDTNRPDMNEDYLRGARGIEKIYHRLAHRLHEEDGSTVRVSRQGGA